VTTNYDNVILKIERSKKMTIGENIAKLRKEKDLTQEELANKINVSPKTISSWEKNRNLPNIEILILLSKELNTSIDSILNLNEENAEDLKKAYHKKALINIFIIILFIITTICIFSYIELEGIVILKAFYYYNDNLITIDNIEYVKDFMLKANLSYIYFIGLLGIYFLLYKKKLKYPLTILSIVTIIIAVMELSDYYYFHVDFFIILIFSIIALICGIKLFKKQK
jgi:transcriptional regulator with XRE-family HTH domain